MCCECHSYFQWCLRCGRSEMQVVNNGPIAMCDLPGGEQRAGRLPVIPAEESGSVTMDCPSAGEKGADRTNHPIGTRFFRF